MRYDMVSLGEEPVMIIMERNWDGLRGNPWIDIHNIVGENTFKCTTLLLLLINYFEANCFLSQFIPKRKEIVRLFMHALKRTTREEYL